MRIDRYLNDQNLLLKVTETTIEVHKIINE